MVNGQMVVSILIVMDSALEDKSIPAIWNPYFFVSILILMDSALEEIKSSLFIEGHISFNPYFNG